MRLRLPSSWPKRVVTVSGSFGAGGGKVGPAVARRLGLPFFDRVVALRVAERLVVPTEQALPHDERVPGETVRSLIQRARQAHPDQQLAKDGVVECRDRAQQGQQIPVQWTGIGPGISAVVLLRTASRARLVLSPQRW